MPDGLEPLIRSGEASGAVVDHAADPAAVRTSLARIGEIDADFRARLAAEPDVLAVYAAVVAASRSLTRLLESDPGARRQLTRLDTRAPASTGSAEELVAWKQRELLRIAALDLVGRWALEEVGAALAEMAGDVFATSVRLTGAEDIAVIGMGKLGGRELNYSSDVDIMFVAAGPSDQAARSARAIMDIARRCFRVDANLRPEGRDGPLVRSLESYEAYWDRWAEPWEFQALLKARPIAGDEAAGRAFDESAQARLWSHPFSTDDLRSMRMMKRRAEQDTVSRGLADRELKRAPGGIRDIEFTLQLLQLVHGQLDPHLRAPNTLEVLAEMAAADYITADDGRQLAEAYRFLRTAEHRVQLVDERQTHQIPVDPSDVERLARVLGYRDTPAATAPEQFMAELRHEQAVVRTIHERVYFRPLLEAFSHAPGALSPEAAVTRLTAFGFTDAKRTQAAVRELTRGLNRSSRLMQQMLPLLLDWLSESPDPDLGLLMLRNLLGAPQRQAVLVETFRDSPDAARRLCTILGTSRLLGDTITHNPDLVARLPDAERLRTLPKDQLVERATASTSWRDDAGSRQEALRRWQARHLLGVAARDVFGFSEVDEVGADLSAIGEAALEAGLALLQPQVPFAVIAMGRFGGAELSYASDLDVLFVYDGAGAGAAEEANRVATRLVRLLNGTTPAERIYEVDVDLRPEGRQGPMARSVDGYLRYWSDYALVWERSAMTRARPVAGDLALAARLLLELEPFVWGDGLGPDEVRELRRIKARVEQERIPPGEDPAFHLKLGRGSLSDVEFTVQMLQLQHGIRATGTDEALDRLEAVDLLTEEDAEILRQAHRFCERTRNRWFLVNSAPGDSLPTQREPLLWLARSLHTTPPELRDRYRKVTRRARRVVERVFYGRD